MTRTKNMASTVTSREVPSYSSSRVQRAARLNNVEATRLLQQMQYLEKAKQHQCRLKNQDIRLVSMSIDYIQAHSGNSQEAWVPPQSPQDETEDANQKPEGPCFMYGERIISRKIRRLARPMSAIERSYGKSYDDDSTSTSTCDDSTDDSHNIRSIPRPKSCCSNNSKTRPSSSMSWLKLSDSRADDSKRTAEYTGALHSARLCYNVSRPSSAVSSIALEREPWEDDTSLITKKILKSQARAQMGKRDSVYESAGAVMNSMASKKVRDLARKTRINSTQFSMNGFDPSISRHSHPGVFGDKPPKRPSTAKDFLGRRATFGEIMSQHKPTLSAGAWRQHLNKRTSHTSPMSATAQQRAMLEAKKHLNESRRADVDEKVRDFMVKKAL